MSAAERMRASAEQIAEFKRIKALRPVVLRKFANALHVWRSCGNVGCRRAHACRSSEASCLAPYMRALPDEDRRLLRYIVVNSANGLSPDDAIQQALDLISAERAMG